MLEIIEIIAIKIAIHVNVIIVSSIIEYIKFKVWRLMIFHVSLLISCIFCRIVLCQMGKTRTVV